MVYLQMSRCVNELFYDKVMELGSVCCSPAQDGVYNYRVNLLRRLVIGSSTEIDYIGHFFEGSILLFFETVLYNVVKKLKKKKKR